MFSSTAASAFTVVSAALSVAVGVLLAKVSRSRAVAQKVSCEVDAEVEVLEVAKTRADLIAVAVGAGMNAESFTCPARSRRWAELAAAASEMCTYTEETAADYKPESGDQEAKIFVKQGEKVLAAQLDRESFEGALPVVRSSSEERPLRFENRPVSRQRFVFSALWMLISVLVSSVAASGNFGLAALMAVAGYGLSVTLVDHDTLFIDYPTFAVGTAASWGLVLLAVQQGELASDNAVMGLIVTAGWILTYKTIDIVLRIVRGVNGLGGGDLLIMISTTGVPVAVTGSLTLGIYAMLATGLLAIAFAIGRKVFTGRSHRDAFALGPFLSAGWLVAYPVLHILEAL